MITYFIKMIPLKDAELKLAKLEAKACKDRQKLYDKIRQINLRD